MNPLEWGKRRGYPALLFEPYAIGPGEYCWKVFWSIAKPEAQAAACATIAEIERQERDNDVTERGA